MLFFYFLFSNSQVLRSHCFSAPFPFLCSFALCSFCCRCGRFFAPFGLLGVEAADMRDWVCVRVCVCMWLFVGRCRFSQSRLSSFCCSCSLASNRSRLSKPKINSMLRTQHLSRRSASPNAHSLSLVPSARKAGMYVGDILGQPHASPDTHSQTLTYTNVMNVSSNENDDKETPRNSRQP